MRHGLSPRLFSLATVAIAIQLSGCATTRTLLDGREKSFVVVGYSTSYAWPAMLQDMLDEHSGGKRTYHVLNAVVGGSPVELWIADPGSDEYNATVAAMVRDFFGPDARLRGEAPAPTVALCQQSLQFTRTRRGPIKSADDREGIRIGTDALEKFALRLHELGLEDVYIGMHIYKDPIEPEVGNERIALAELLKRGHKFIHQGPDVWTMTRKQYPSAYADDKLHPNEQGIKLMAEGWYRTIAGPSARQDVIDRMHARHYDVNLIMRRYIRWRRSEHVACRERIDRGCTRVSLLPQDVPGVPHDGTNGGLFPPTVQILQVR